MNKQQTESNGYQQQEAHHLYYLWTRMNDEYKRKLVRGYYYDNEGNYHEEYSLSAEPSFEFNYREPQKYSDPNYSHQKFIYTLTPTKTPCPGKVPLPANYWDSRTGTPRVE